MSWTIFDKVNITFQIVIGHIIFVITGKRLITIRLPKINRLVKLNAFSSDLGDLFQTFVLEQFKFSLDKSPTLIIDAGANIGCSSLWFHYNFPKAKVVCIEPFNGNFIKLITNISGLKNIKAIKSGIWYRKANLMIKNVDERRNRIQVVETKNNKENIFKSVTVGELIGNENQVLLKLDIEGAEDALFLKNYDWLSKVDSIIIELHEWREKGSSNNFFKAIKNFNFIMLKRGELLLLTKS